MTLGYRLPTRLEADTGSGQADWCSTPLSTKFEVCWCANNCSSVRVSVYVTGWGRVVGAELVFWAYMYLCMYHHISAQLRLCLLHRQAYAEQKELQVKLQKVCGQDGWRQRCEFDQASRELQFLGAFLASSSIIVLCLALACSVC